MEKRTTNPIFKTVVSFTSCCGLGAFFVAMVPVFVSSAAGTPFLEPMFNTLTYLFSTGVGAIFGMLSVGQ